ncbi:MAG: hypothetical protein IJ751_08305 [Oscillospiraceae bacterium]|nr:hypothetical protein [Oscillospiraceae bacterium]
MAMPNMKGSSSPLLRAMYIVLVPVVLLIVLLNSGWLQRLLPAAAVHGETYSVVRYNYYYFDYYNAFLEENADRLDELHYDPSTNAGQQNYADGVTWREYFRQQGEQALMETAYYCDLAEAAGYVFSEEELAPIQRRLEDNEAARISYGIRSASSYYVSYYGPGMNESRYTAELTRSVKAQAYKAHLIDAYQPGEAEIAAWLADHSGADYQGVNVRAITLKAISDRSTGEVGTPQLTALSAQLDRLGARYAAGEDFADLQAAFSTRSAGDSAGAMTVTRASDLPEGLLDELLGDQAALPDTLSYVDEAEGVAYFLVIDGFAGSGLTLEAEAALSEAAIAAQEEAMGGYQVERNPIGMLIATS